MSKILTANTSRVLEVRGLCVEVAARSQGPNDLAKSLVHDLSLDLREGEILGLVGDSGSGKTLTALAIMGLLPPSIRQSAGSLRIAGVDMRVGKPEAREDHRRAPVGMIFQEPRSALNPLFSIGFQIAECLRLDGLKGRAIKKRGVELLELVALPDPESRWRSFPHELSGGQCQRVMLAMALAGRPRVLIADEPTTALDASVQAQVLDLILRLKVDLGLAVLLISHDLAVVAALCHRLMIMEEGRLVETGLLAEIFDDPQAVATRRLLAAARLELGVDVS